jgi:hypothetical protein
MGNFNAADVIQAAATSNLGVISLLVLVLAFLAWRFFQRSDDKVKLIAFAMMFLGSAGFVASVMVAGGEAENRPGPEASPTATTDPAAAAMSAPDAASAGAVPNIAGDWRDSDGYSFTFSQDGKTFAYNAFLNGKQVGTGAGTLTGNRLVYHFTDTANGNQGDCEGDVATDGKTIRGTCGDGSARWDFAIER